MLRRSQAARRAVDDDAYFPISHRSPKKRNFHHRDTELRITHGVPAKAGTHPSAVSGSAKWVPAFAGTRDSFLRVLCASVVIVYFSAAVIDSRRICGIRSRIS